MKTAVVTGVTSGIGAALVTRLIQDGMRVVGIARDEQRLRRVAEAHGDAFRGLRAELACPEARDAAFAEVAALPRVDVVVHNAAECLYEAPLALEPSRARRLFEVNVLAGLELVRAGARAMHEGGHVILVSSVTTRFVANERFVPYAATKSALETFGEGLRLELVPRGIVVSVVVPGLVDTPIYDKFEGFARAKEKVRAQVPEWLEPGDVADAIAWIVSRPARVAIPELVITPRRQAR